jgi:hypothetical protein
VIRLQVPFEHAVMTPALEADKVVSEDGFPDRHCRFFCHRGDRRLTGLRQCMEHGANQSRQVGAWDFVVADVRRDLRRQV